MIEKATVVGIEEGRARVALERSEQCDRCGLCVMASGRPELEVRSIPDLRPGDVVSVEISSSAMLRGATLLFLVPIIFFVVGAALSRPIMSALGIGVGENFGALVTGFVFLGLAFLGACLVERTRRKHMKSGARIVRIEESYE